MAAGDTEWIDSEGLVTVLAGEAWGREGFSGARPLPVMYRSGSEAGMRLGSVREEPAELVIPYVLTGNGAAAYETARRALLRTLKRGPGQIRRTDEAGAQRTLDALYVGGLESAGEWHVDAALADLEFISVGEPYWVSTIQQSRTYDLDVVSGTWLPQGLLPLVTDSSLFAADNVEVTGDVHSWPTWSITGPMDDLILRHLDDELALDLTGYSIAAGDVVSVVTEPGSITLTSAADGALWNDLSDESTFWRLNAENNQVRVEAGGATTDSQVVMTWHNRTEGE